MILWKSKHEVSFTQQPMAPPPMRRALNYNHPLLLHLMMMIAY
jgi:hypothetical protein